MFEPPPTYFRDPRQFSLNPGYTGVAVGWDVEIIPNRDVIVLINDLLTSWRSVANKEIVQVQLPGAPWVSCPARAAWRGRRGAWGCACTGARWRTAAAPRRHRPASTARATRLRWCWTWLCCRSPSVEKKVILKSAGLRLEVSQTHTHLVCKKVVFQ